MCDAMYLMLNLFTGHAAFVFSMCILACKVMPSFILASHSWSHHPVDASVPCHSQCQYSGYPISTVLTWPCFEWVSGHMSHFHAPWCTCSWVNNIEVIGIIDISRGLSCHGLWYDGPHCMRGGHGPHQSVGQWCNNVLSLWTSGKDNIFIAAMSSVHSDHLCLCQFDM